MTDSPLLRVSKLMADRGMCSRREADSYIERGWVKVNGEVATLGLKVAPDAAEHQPRPRAARHGDMQHR